MSGRRANTLILLFRPYYMGGTRIFRGAAVWRGSLIGAPFLGMGRSDAALPRWRCWIAALIMTNYGRRRDASREEQDT